MLRTVEAIIDANGQVRLLESVSVSRETRAIVTILGDDGMEEGAHLPALLSEKALADDWNRPEEDQAWAHLQQDRSS